MENETKKKIIFGAAGIAIGVVIGAGVARVRTEDEITSEIYRLATKRVEEYKTREALKDNE